MTDTSAEQALHRERESLFSGQIVVFSGKIVSVGLREAREIVENLGGATAVEVTDRTTMLVVGSGGPDSSGATRNPKVRQAEQVNADTPGRVQITTEEDFCRLTGLTSPQTLARQYHSVHQLRERYPSVREDHLRYLEKWSLVHPIARTKLGRYYGFRDLRIVRQVSEALESGTSFRVVLRALVSARDGQLTLDFNRRIGEIQPVKVVTLKPRSAGGAAPQGSDEALSLSSSPVSLAARYFREGSSLDEGGSESDQEEACRAYRKALLLDPNLVPALVNLANIHYARDDLVEAQALHERAMHLDDECFEAYFNVGNIHHDLGRYLDALEHYRVALSINPGYPDAHFYLAVTLEKIGHSEEAKAHWRAYRDLAPEGEWIELAKEFSE
ncbi:uncharacterized protein METZ01_LOCUS43729 [marine metagenome]|uniref:BRCT domain-containing protein n=1 Tax=marine metagenome TaxID=408172 RepID=A0A381RGE2_9ZZZZ